MDHQEIRDSLAVFALGAVEPGEQAEIEGHLVDCEPCRDEITSFRRAVSLLTFVTEVGDDAPPSPSAVGQACDTVVVARPRAWRRAGMGVVVAAGLAVVALVGAGANRRAHELETLRATLTEPVEQAFIDATREPGTATFSLRSPDGTIELPSAVTSDGHGYLDAEALSPLPVDRTYQLWGVIDGRRVSLGLLGTDPTIVSFDPRLFTEFAVTDERAGGADASLTGAVVTGSLD